MAGQARLLSRLVQPLEYRRTSGSAGFSSTCGSATRDSARSLAALARRLTPPGYIELELHHAVTVGHEIGVPEAIEDHRQQPMRILGTSSLRASSDDVPNDTRGASRLTQSQLPPGVSYWTQPSMASSLGRFQATDPERHKGWPPLLVRGRVPSQGTGKATKRASGASEEIRLKRRVRRARGSPFHTSRMRLAD